MIWQRDGVEVEFGGPAGLGNQPKNCSQDS